jgi:hypothetical protein
MKPKLHWSQISQLCRCGIQYEFRYVKEIIRPPAIALIVGSATHVSIEKNLKHKLETKGTLLSDAEVRQIAADEINTRWEKDGADLSSLDEDEVGKGEKAVRGGAVDTAVSLASLHHHELAPGINPVHLERVWDLEIAGFPVDLRGTIDVQEESRIRDTKTAKRSPPEGTADKSEQLTMYAMATHILDKKIPELQLDNLVKTKVPKVVIQKTMRTEDDFAPLLARIAAASKAIESGIFMPCAPDHWCCSPKWCGYYGMCPMVKARKQIAVPSK